MKWLLHIAFVFKYFGECSRWNKSRSKEDPNCTESRFGANGQIESQQNHRVSEAVHHWIWSITHRKFQRRKHNTFAKKICVVCPSLFDIKLFLKNLRKIEYYFQSRCFRRIMAVKTGIWKYSTLHDRFLKFIIDFLQETQRVKAATASPRLSI